MSRKETLYIEDIKSSIKQIEEYIEGFDYHKFINDRKTVDAVIRNLEILGEAARSLPKEFALKYPEVPWSKMIGMRNKALHEYFGVDEEILWKTVIEDIPTLKKQLQNL